jgi:cation:H+ antiporter
MTCIYVLGMLERADRTVLGIGWDSALALVVYVAGMAVLYTLR